MKKHIIYIILLLLGWNLQAQVVLSDKNYIHTTVPQVGMTIAELENVNCATINYIDKAIESVTYFDGLGRPIQERAIKASPDGKDIVTHIEYDAYGRQAKQYLPFEADNTIGSYKDINVNTDINQYYKDTYTSDFPGITDLNQINAYSESVFEASPLNRVLEQGAPGKDWKANPNSDIDHTIKFDWDTNAANEVVYFKVDFANPVNTEDPSLVKDGFYAPNQLYVAITKDENWTPADGNNHTTKEYKDKQGRVVLKRNFNEGSAHDTYYVYDRFGKLTYVISPKVNVTDGVSESELSELCYQYKYDNRNRLIEMKVAGKDWKYIVYNKLDQPILTQDASLRKEMTGKAWNQWLFTKYDAFGRVLYTGTVINGANRKVIQNNVNNATTPQYESKLASSIVIGGTTMYYSKDAYPTSMYKVFTINYYDDYNFDLAGLTNPGTVYGETISDQTKTLPTGSKVRVLETNDWITTVTRYDNKSRPIYVASKNEYLNTTDIVESKLDFTGKVEETKTTHIKDNNAAIVTIDTFTYDHMGRMLTQAQKVNNQPFQAIVSNIYDKLGKLKIKTTGSGLQTIDYKLHVRGWLKGINDVNNLGNDLFAYNVNYSRTTENVEASPLYNGNISEMIWKTANDDTKHAYGYKYNALNYLTGAKSSDSRYDVSNIVYDPNGNIISLTRHGWQNTTSYTNMDILNYQYNSGNKLLKVTDTGNKTYGFKDGTNTNDDFDYDINGNMIQDQNKGITGITYNYLNLPKSYTFQNNPNRRIDYVYDATGTQLKKTITDGTAITVTEYNNGIEYKNGILQMIINSEGYIEPENNGSFTFVYQFKDYLKNVRLAYADNDKDGKIDIVRNFTDIDGDGDNHHEIRQVKDYYPYGLSWKYGSTHPNSLITGSKNNYGYNGKEYTEGLDLNLYEMDVRKYDPAIARWSSIDPIMNGTLSPYTAFDNNPAFWNDPSGASVIVTNGGDNIKFTGQDAIDAFKILTGGNSENEESNENNEEQGEGECCLGLKKLFNEVLNKAYGKSTKDFDFYSDNYWVGDDGYTYYVAGDNEFYKIYWNRYEQVDELPPMMNYMEIMSPAGIGKKGLSMMGAKAGKTSMVYWSVRGGKIIYVGITNNFARRSLQHLKKKGIEIEYINNSLTKLSRSDAKAVEQVLIEYFGLGGKKGQTGQLLNRINSIAKKNKVYAESIKKGKELLEAAGFAF